MKKILLATTILSMSAGFAAADVAVSGSARMGVVATDGASTFSSRIDMTFSGSGTTDSGLAFGAKFDADDAVGAHAGSQGSTYISGAFGKISMGSLDSGDASAVGQLASIGYTGLGYGNSINYSADGTDGFGLFATSTTVDNVADGGGAKVLYTYAANGLSLSVSTAQLSNTAADHTAYGVGAAYTTGALTLAVGYGSTDVTVGNIKTNTTALGAGTTAAVVALDGFAGSITDTSVSAKYVTGATTIKAIYQVKELDVTRAATTGSATATTTYTAVASTHTLSATSMGVSVVQAMDALTLTAYTVSTSVDTTLASTDLTVTRSGIGAAYNLGGGATLTGGYAVYNTPDVIGAPTVASLAITSRAALTSVSHNVFDLGVNFSF
jgi:outer membrane protein OmpU